MKIEIKTFSYKAIPIILLIFFLFFPGSCKVLQVGKSDILSVYITWENDPSRSATICWIQHKKTKPKLLLREKGDADWSTYSADIESIPHSRAFFYQSEITDLDPGKTYEFLVHTNDEAFHFTTMPESLDSSISFIVGGDISVSSTASKMNQHAGKRKPDFVVWGGDLAYANGRLRRSGRFIQFWREWFKHSTIDGRIIPVISAIGNHEVRGGYGGNVENAPFFYMFFPHKDNSGYRAVDFGHYLSILLLDTDHTNEIKGSQTRWLESALSERNDIPHVVPVYHVPAYPSHRSFNGSRSVAVRENWVPLFDTYNIPVVFEHHDHTFKRTVPIKNGKADPAGTVYLGDGAWGVSTRRVRGLGKRWYLEKASSTHHFFEVKLYPEKMDIQAINSNNTTFDKINRPARIQ